MKIYDVDAAIREQRPVIVLRGRKYELNLLTVREQIQYMLDTKAEQDTAQENLNNEAQVKAEAEGRDFAEVYSEMYWDTLKPILAKALCSALVGIDPEILDSLSELEYKALQNAIRLARNDAENIEVLPTEGN